MLADEVDYVIGVDTHRDQHTLAVVVAPTGAVVAQTVGAGERRGYCAALAFADESRGRRSCLGGRGRRPLRCRADALPRRPRRNGRSRSAAAARGERRLQGKDDPLDAIRAARTALAAKTLTLPRAGQRQEALRRAAARPPQRRRCPPARARPAAQRDRHRARELAQRAAAAARRAQLIRRCSRFRRSSSRTPDELAIVLVLRSLARRIEAATAEADELEREILDHVRALVPQAARRARRRPDRRRATDRHLVTPRPRPLRSRLRTPRRRRTTARLKRPNDPPPPQPRRRPPTQPRPPHRHPPPPPTRPRDHATTSPAASPKAKAARDATRILKRYLARHLYRVMQNASPAMT